MTSPIASTAPPISAKVVTLMFGNTVVAIRIIESSTRVATIALGERVEPGRVAPRAEDFAVVAEQQQEDAGAGEQDAGERLDGFGDQPERRAGDQHDRGRAGDQSGEEPVEELGVAPVAVQRALHPGHIPERVAGGQGQSAGADQRGVEQHDRKQCASGRAERPMRPAAVPPASVKCPK